MSDDRAAGNPRRFDFDFATDEQLKALGRITLHYAQLESGIRWFLQDLINEDDRFPGMVIGALSSFRVICDAVAMLAERETRRYPNDEKIQEGYKRLSTVLKKVHQLEAQRNTLAHSDWMMSGNASKLLRIKAGKDHQRRYKNVVTEIDADEINALAEDFVATDYEIFGIFADFMDAVRDCRRPPDPN